MPKTPWALNSQRILDPPFYLNKTFFVDPKQNLLIPSRGLQDGDPQEQTPFIFFPVMPQERAKDLKIHDPITARTRRKLEERKRIIAQRAGL